MSWLATSGTEEEEEEEEYDSIVRRSGTERSAKKKISYWIYDEDEDIEDEES